MVKEDTVYLLSIISECTYNKMVDNLPDGYICVSNVEANSFYFIGKELPSMINNSVEETYILMKKEWDKLIELKTTFAIGKMQHNPKSEPSLT